MLSIFVDTCVWHHWFTFDAGTVPHERIRQHCESFGKIYELVRSSPERARFLYNQRIEDELGERFKNEFTEKVLPVSTKIPIPLTRFDGAYCFDGSFLGGGRMGGSLRGLLTLHGYPHDAAVSRAAEALKEGEELYETAPRKREFDIEHMESALEARADLFLTNDERTILEWLQTATTRCEKNHPICLMHSIARTPTAALFYVQGELGA